MGAKLVGTLGYGLTILLLAVGLMFAVAAVHGFSTGDARNSWQALIMAGGLFLLAFSLSSVTYVVLK